MEPDIARSNVSGRCGSGAVAAGRSGRGVAYAAARRTAGSGDAAAGVGCQRIGVLLRRTCSRARQHRRCTSARSGGIRLCVWCALAGGFGRRCTCRLCGRRCGTDLRCMGRRCAGRHRRGKAAPHQAYATAEEKGRCPAKKGGNINQRMVKITKRHFSGVVSAARRRMTRKPRAAVSLSRCSA